MTTVERTDAPPQAQPQSAGPASAPPAPSTPQWKRPPRTLRPRPRNTTHGMVAWIAAVMVVLIGWLVAYSFVLSSLEHAHAQSVMYADFRQQLAEATAPINGAVTPGKPVGIMNMPSAGIHDEVIVQGTGSQQLADGPGHKRDSPLPGQPGVSLLYGRSTLFGGPFGDIADAKPGDTITIRTGLGLAKYVVERVRRPGEPYSPALASGAGRLTLVTADGKGWRSGWAPSSAVYVDASLASKPFPDTGNRPASVPEYEAALRGDPNAFYSLVLWLPILLAGAVGVVWLHGRWGAWQSWLIGAPVVIAGLWGVSETAAQLLPNLM